MADECIHCGARLPPGWQQPCPVCGKTCKEINVSVADGVNLTDDLAMGNTLCQ
jgi:hypothetical protein